MEPLWASGITQREAFRRNSIEKIIALRKQIALECLVSAQMVYGVVVGLYEDRVESTQRLEIGTVESVRAGQQALDAVRMINSAEVIKLAEEL